LQPFLPFEKPPKALSVTITIKYHSLVIVCLLMTFWRQKVKKSQNSTENRQKSIMFFDILAVSLQIEKV
jgi:hypothetical protein